jgi:hypothetical protein
LNPKSHEAQLEDQKGKKDHLEEGKIARPTKVQKMISQAK